MCECPDCERTFDSMDHLVDHRTDEHDAFTMATTGAVTAVDAARAELERELATLEDEYGAVAVEAALSLADRGGEVSD